MQLKYYTLFYFHILVYNNKTCTPVCFSSLISLSFPPLFLDAYSLYKYLISYCNGIATNIQKGFIHILMISGMFTVLSIHVHWRNCAGACSQTTMDYLYMYTNYKIKGNIFEKKTLKSFRVVITLTQSQELHSL